MYMQKRILAILISISATLFLASCSKEGDNSPAAKTKTELITQGSWKYESGTYGGAAIPTSMSNCVLDNSMTFTSTTYTITEGAVVCSPTTATPSPQAWSFQSGETQLVLANTLIPGSTSGTFTIVTLNETNLVISQNVTIPPSPFSAPLVITFKH